MKLLCKHEGRYIQDRHARTPTTRLFANINELSLRSKNEGWLVDPHHIYSDIYDNRQCVWYLHRVVPEKEKPITF